MELREGLPVYSAEGDKLGEIERVVMHPATLEVTDVVVEKGTFFTEERVIPIEAIKDADGDGVRLDAGIDFEHFAPFEQRRYLPWEPGERGYVPEGGPRVIFMPPVGTWGHPTTMDTMWGARRIEAMVRNIPEGLVALEPGAEVYSADGEHLGEVERVFTSEDGSHVTHFLVEEGLFFKDRKLVPAAWVAAVKEEEVRLAVNADLVEATPAFQES